MFIISQEKAQDFASLSMRVSYRETKAGQLEHKTILIEAKRIHLLNRVLDKSQSGLCDHHWTSSKNLHGILHGISDDLQMTEMQRWILNFFLYKKINKQNLNHLVLEMFGGLFFFFFCCYWDILTSCILH